MQNVDYSRRIRKPGGWGPEEGEPVLTTDSGVKAKNRLYATALALVMVAFAAGLFLGVQLAKVKNIEESIVKNPDKPLKDTSDSTSGRGDSSFADNGETGEGRFLIKVGAFGAAQAEKVTSRLNSIPEVAQTKPLACRDIHESVPDRYMAFRTKVNDNTNRQNVIVGCFSSETKARQLLTMLASSSIPEAAAARVYEIE